MPDTNPDLPADFFVISNQGQAEFYALLFSNTWEKVDGYFISVFKGCEYRGKPAEKIIRQFFIEK
jgi:hypothetical protein